MAKMKRHILIINPFGVGDVLFSTPLVVALKKLYRGAYVGYICNIRTKEMLQTNPDVDEVFVFERDEYRLLWKTSKLECIKKLFDFWRTIHRRKFDVVIDLSLSKEYAFLCWLVGIRERRGFNFKGRGRFLTYRIPFDGFNDKPVGEYYLDLMSMEKPARDITTVLVTADNDRRYIEDFLKTSGVRQNDLLVGIAPGGGASFGKKDQGRRRWGAGKFRELADRIAEKYKAKIILIWGHDERDVVEKISAGMKNSALIAPTTTIREMAALCKKCRLVICSEGGPLHIASSQGVKTVSIFGPVDEKVYGPYPPSQRNVVVTSRADCRPCYRRFKLPECNTRKCLEDITVDDVFNEIAKLDLNNTFPDMAR